MRRLSDLCLVHIFKFKASITLFKCAQIGLVNAQEEKERCKNGHKIINKVFVKY